MICDLNTVDMTQLLHRELGVRLYEGCEGSILRQGELGSVLTDITSGKRLLKLLKELKIPQITQLAVKSEDAFEALKQAYGFSERCPCSQWVYTAKEPPEQVSCDIRPLGLEHTEQVVQHYHLVADPLSYIRNRIVLGQMWGLFEGDKLAGFIGTHDEGAIGLLEIFPDYRRRGYGYALEAWLIAHELAQGFVPYCHVVEGNIVSEALQQKLGMVRADLPVLWIS